MVRIKQTFVMGMPTATVDPKRSEPWYGHLLSPRTMDPFVKRLRWGSVQ